MPCIERCEADPNDRSTGLLARYCDLALCTVHLCYIDEWRSHTREAVRACLVFFLISTAMRDCKGGTLPSSSRRLFH